MFFDVFDVCLAYVLAGRRLGHIDTTFTRRVVDPCDVPVKECGCFAPHTEGRSPPHASTTPAGGRAWVGWGGLSHTPRCGGKVVHRPARKSCRITKPVIQNR